MVKDMALSKATQEARGPDLPMMHSVMGCHVTEVTKHHSRSETCCDLNGRDQDCRHSHEGDENKHAEPSWSPHQRLLVAVMDVMLPLYPDDVMQDVTVEKIFGQAPDRDASNQGRKQREPTAGLACEGKGHKYGSHSGISVKISEEGGSTQLGGWRRRVGRHDGSFLGGRILLELHCLEIGV
jgi:hypothetical protein